MKKNLFKRLFSVLLAFCLLFSSTTVINGQSNEVRLSFLAMSDLHLDDLLFQTSHKNIDQFQTVLDTVEEMDLDLFVGGGDYSSYGNSKYWNKIKTMVTSAGFDQSIWALGNHEYGTTGLLFYNKSKFAKFNGEKYPYYVKHINGYTFIVLGAETGLVGTFGKMSSTMKKWFKNTLKSEVANSNGKPIFIVSHYDLSTGNMDSNVGDVMAQYQDANIFFLWGHMHDGEYADMTFDQCISQKGNVTIARMGSVHYYNNDNADGLIVKVYDDRVELQMKRVDGATFENDTVTVDLK